MILLPGRLITAKLLVDGTKYLGCGNDYSIYFRVGNKYEVYFEMFLFEKYWDGTCT